ncbi:hypothetical protein C6P99_10640 [Burkholderia multivorans]|uniref:Uncharacterized protein n=1 Tax=Burkholderia multivorans TaxID=87883 RepID=A0AB37AV12_9BURK|nr:hypothetical protein C6P99_10640 [Burkholderia multivorans]
MNAARTDTQDRPAMYHWITRLLCLQRTVGLDGPVCERDTYFRRIARSACLSWHMTDPIRSPSDAELVDAYLADTSTSARPFRARVD